MHVDPHQGNERISGKLPLTVLMITLNEERHLRELLPQITEWIQEVVIVDSCSTDATVSVALEHGAQVVQRSFTGFSDQWNFALSLANEPWVIKMDPDERVSAELQRNIRNAISADTGEPNGYRMHRRLWFMGRPLHVFDEPVRMWRNGTASFGSALVNEHCQVTGRVGLLAGYLEHHDSPDLHAWLDKQNRYTSLEALVAFEKRELAANPRLTGSKLERRMWIKSRLRYVPLRFGLLRLYFLFAKGAWRDGSDGWEWSRLRVWVYRLRELKLREMRRLGQSVLPPDPVKTRDERVPHVDVG